MKKGNKGFTLVELIAMIVILGIIAILATPNIVRMVDNGKKKKFVADAIELIGVAKYKNKLEKYDEIFKIDTDNSNCVIASAHDLGLQNKENPDGILYDLEKSKVKVCGDSQYFVEVFSDNTDSNANKIRGVGTVENNVITYVSDETLRGDSAINYVFDEKVLNK